jgi:hypothetical protein
VLGSPPPAHQPGPLEDLQVLRDGLDADRERLGELIDGGVPQGETGEDRPARRIREGRERGAELVDLHL